jgi:F-type H+-transporting ATPase subunit delta
MAAEAKLVEKVEKDLMDLKGMIESSSDLVMLIQNPLVSKKQQQTAIAALAKKAKFQNLTSNFLGVLAHNKRMGRLPSVIAAFTRELSERRGEVEAHVESAFSLSASQSKKLQEQLSKVVGSEVALNVSVNKDLLGGMVVTIGSTMIDDSVRRKLEKLGRKMGAGSNDQQLKEVG